jgi:hypothetical protein
VGALINALANAAAPAAVAVAGELVLMTRRQMKLGAVLGIAGLVVALAAYLVYRSVAARRARSAEPEPGPPALRPSEPPVDQAVANVLARAGARAGDTRTVADLVDGALRVVTDLGGVSVPALQRRLEIDFERATELVVRLEADGFVSAPGANGKRKVLPAAFEHVERLGPDPGDA